MTVTSPIGIVLVIGVSERELFWWCGFCCCWFFVCFGLVGGFFLLLLGFLVVASEVLHFVIPLN